MDQALLKDLFEEESTHWWHVAKRKLIWDFLPLPPGRALVLGIGGGRLCHELSKTFEVTAADISHLACAHLQETYGLSAVECDFNKGLPLATGKFQVAIMADVLEHIRDDKKFLEEIRGRLAEAGLLVLTVPAYAHMWSYWDDRLHHCRRYEYAPLKDLVRAAGFEIEKMSFFNTLIYPPAFIRRKIFTAAAGGPSDFRVFQGGALMKALMGCYYAAERKWLRMAGLPFGLSLLVCGRKT